MANTDDLVRFLKADMVHTGELIHFCDAGSIGEKEFKQNDGSTKKNLALEMEVMIGDTMKRIIYSPNKTTVDLLKTAWGKDTVTWVGETGMVEIINQLSFGKVVPVLVVKPLTNLNKATTMQAAIERARSQQAPPPPNAGAQLGSNPVPVQPLNAWEQEEKDAKEANKQG